jgi:HEAT repeat protein
MLQDDSALVRASAATALGKMVDARATDALHRALDDPDPGVRCQAVRALGRIGDPRALPSLRPLLNDQTEVFGSSIAEFVQSAIRRIKQRETELTQRTVKAYQRSAVEKPG